MKNPQALDMLQVSTEISPNDVMYGGNRDHYLATGRSAVQSIEAARALVGASDPQRILDLPCGHGRVLRTLRAAFPAAQVTACDLERDGVDFCVRTFNVTGIYSEEDPASIQLPGPYELIWCGSLLTHLPVARWEAFLQLFERILAPGGVAVFTTHGRRTEGWLRRGKGAVGLSIEQLYGLTPPLVTDLLRSHERSGFGYVDYPGQQGYGFSLSTLPFALALVQKVTGLRLVVCFEHGWDDHQDVIACAKPV